MNQSNEEMIERLEALLDELDDAEGTEDLSDLNATFEDVIFLLRESDADDADARTDAAAELSDLARGYARLGLDDEASRLASILSGMR